MKQVSVTFDAPTYAINRVENLMFAMDLTRVKNNDEQANYSIGYRMLIVMGMSDYDSFYSWYELHKKDETGQLGRCTVQMTDKLVQELADVATKAKIMKKDEGQLVPNLTQAIVALLRYSVDNPDSLVEWFRMCIEEALQ